MKQAHSTARYQVIPTADGSRYRFFCELSGALLCETEPIRAETPEEGLALAWERQGRRYFNRCHCCGRWVSDVMYNADELQCVRCAPWQAVQRYCTACGAPLKAGQTCCSRCGRPVERRCG